MSGKTRKISIFICIAVLAVVFAGKGFFANLLRVENIIEDAGQSLSLFAVVNKSDGSGKDRGFAVTTQEARAVNYRMSGHDIVMGDCDKRLKKLGVNAGDKEYEELVFNDKYEGREVFIYKCTVDSNGEGAQKNGAKGIWRVILVENETPVIFDVPLIENANSEEIYRYAIDENAIYLHRTTENNNDITTKIDVKSGEQTEIAVTSAKGNLLRYNAKTGEIITLETQAKRISKYNVGTKNKITFGETESPITQIFAVDDGYLGIDAQKIGEIQLCFFDENLKEKSRKKVELPVQERSEAEKFAMANAGALDGDILYLSTSNVYDGGNSSSMVVSVNIKTAELLQATEIKVRDGYEMKWQEFANAAGVRPMETLQ